MAKRVRYPESFGLRGNDNHISLKGQLAEAVFFRFPFRTSRLSHHPSLAWIPCTCILLTLLISNSNYAEKQMVK
mgnify:CR=1 FL=1